MPAPSELCHDSWPLVSCQPSGPCSHLANLNPDHKTAIEQAAVEYLWRWTGRRFGLCTVSIRPCAEECLDRSTFQGWAGRFGSGLYPLIRDGAWYNTICGKCKTSRCACDDLSTIVLPGPVYDVTEVLIDGVALTPGVDYRLDNLGLARRGGLDWPKCQNMDNDPTESLGDPTDTFLVTYRVGEPVPAGGQLAAGTLACELAKQACGDKTCRLPRRAISVASQGVTVMLPTNDELFSHGTFGITEIDTFLASVQKDNKSGWKVTSPDRKPYRQVW
jgi:hypothetical protein